MHSCAVEHALLPTCIELDGVCPNAVMSFDRPLLHRISVSIRVLLKYLSLVPGLGPPKAGTFCIITHTVICLVSITYFVYFLKSHHLHFQSKVH